MGRDPLRRLRHRAARPPVRQERYADPNRFDITRTGTQQLSFAAGIHYCLGAPLARLEGEVVFERLLSRFPNVAGDTTPVWRPSLTLRGLETLQVSGR